MPPNDSTADELADDRLDADGVACTLTEAEAERRRERVADELLPHLEAVEVGDDAVTFTFEGTERAVETVTEFVRLEHRCCSFVQFDLRVGPREEPVRLDASGEGTVAAFEEGMKPLVEASDASLSGA